MENIFFDKSQLKHCGKNVIIGKTVRIRKPEECIIGDNVIIDDFAYISCSIEIGNNCHIAGSAVINGGVIINDNCFIGSAAVIQENTEIKKNSIIPANFFFKKIIKYARI